MEKVLLHISDISHVQPLSKDRLVSSWSVTTKSTQMFSSNFFYIWS